MDTYALFNVSVARLDGDHFILTVVNKHAGLCKKDSCMFEFPSVSFNHLPMYSVIHPLVEDVLCYVLDSVSVHGPKIKHTKHTTSG